MVARKSTATAAPVQDVAPDTALAAVTLKHKATGPKLTQSVHKLYQKLVEVKLARKKLHEQLMATPPGQQLEAFDTEIEGLTGQLKGILGETEGVMETPFGKVGFETRRTVTYPPDLIRSALPDFAEKLIGETVNTKAVDAFVKACVGAESMSPEILVQLEKGAKVEKNKAWIDKPLVESK